MHPETNDRNEAPASIARLRRIDWQALRGLAPALDEPLSRVLSGVPAERVLDRFLRNHRALPNQKRAVAAEALFGVGLWRRRLLAQLGREAVPPRWLLASLVRDLGGLPGAEAIVELAPGTLPAPLPPPEDLARCFSFPDWLAETLRREAGEEAPALADALDQPGPIGLRPNLLRTTREALAARLEREGVRVRPARSGEGLLVVSPRPNLYGLAAWREALFEVQDEASQLAGALVEARPGDEVLDLCAGAGGKTLQLASAMQNRGRLHAFDVDRERLDRLRRRAARAGVANLEIHASGLPESLRVGRVLVDAPCSELGALRRGPDLRFRLDPARFEPLPVLQRDLLERAARHLRPGGRLVYVTCTFRHEENEEVVVAFEAAHPELARIRPGAPEEIVGADGFFRAWPHRHGTDGFFGAVLERRPQT